MFFEVCEYLHNYFCTREDMHFGKFEIKNGVLMPLDFLKDGQYFRIVGSTLNDGVYQYPTADFVDESFEGAVWAMSFPPSFIALVGDIEKYEKSDANKPAPFTSESFGGYSYSKATNSAGAPIGWQAVFSDRLRKWRKI